MKGLYHGDCIEVMRSLPENSIDTCITDPPYHLTSIVKRFGGENAAPAQYGTDGAFARASKGFMGKTWDGGNIAADPATWAEVYRLLKPGGLLLAFGGTRTYHRMVCAIEDIKTEFNEKIDALTERNATISNTLKAYVIENGSTLNGKLHQVVYTKGRVSWDTKKLDGYAAAHPEILEFKTEGEPSASLRARRS